MVHKGNVLVSAVLFQPDVSPKRGEGMGPEMTTCFPVSSRLSTSCIRFSMRDFDCCSSWRVGLLDVGLCDAPAMGRAEGGNPPGSRRAGPGESGVCAQRQNLRQVLRQLTAIVAAGAKLGKPFGLSCCNS